jgi:hypothetical protein
MNNLQEQLNELYLEYLKKIFMDRDLYNQVLNFKLSSPLFLDCEADFGKYKNADYKILYVGKETNYWFNKKEREKCDLLRDLSDYEKYLEALISLYKTFNLGRGYKKAFFTFLDIIVEQLRNKNDSVGVLWTNLLRHDSFGNGKISPEIKQKITFDNNYILRKEIEILKPDVIIFVTGPNYDSVLENTFPGLKKIRIDNESEREICFFEHVDLPQKSIRVYHPDYHWRIDADYRWNLAERIEGLLSFS